MKFILRTFEILAVVAVIAVAGYFFYTMFLAPTTQQQTVNSEQGTVRASSRAPAAAVKPISQFAALDYWVNSKTNAIYYLTEDGRVMKTFGDGKDEEAGKQNLPEFNRLIAAPDGTKVIAVFGYPLATVFALYDTAANSWERLPADTLSAAFDPASTRVAYIRASANSANLYILTLADKKSKQIMPIGFLGDELVWRSADEIILTDAPTGKIAAPMFLLNISKKTLTDLSRGAPALAMLWGAEGLGLKLAPSATEAGELILTHSSGVDLLILPFVTLPSKCALTEALVYCAVPTEFPARAALPDDYLKEKFYTEDSIVSFNANEKTQTEVLGAGAGSFDAEHLTVRGNEVLFRNRYDGKIYSVKK